MAVLGSGRPRDLFPDDDPIGKTIRIKGRCRFRRGRRADPRGAGPGGSSLDNAVLIPVSTASRRLFNRDFLTMVITQILIPSIRTRLWRKFEACSKPPPSACRRARRFHDDQPHSHYEAGHRALGSTLQRVLLILSILATAMSGVVILSITLIGVAERRRKLASAARLARHDRW